MATAQYFAESNAAFSVAGGPTIPALIRDQGVGEGKTREYVSIWYFDHDELVAISQTGLLYLRLLATDSEFIRINVWDAAPYTPSLHTGGASSWQRWQLSQTGRETVLITRYVVLSMVGAMRTCELTAIRPI